MMFDRQVFGEREAHTMNRMIGPMLLLFSLLGGCASAAPHVVANAGANWEALLPACPTASDVHCASVTVGAGPETYWQTTVGRTRYWPVGDRSVCERLRRLFLESHQLQSGPCTGPFYFERGTAPTAGPR